MEIPQKLLPSKLAAPVDLSGAAAPAPLSEGEPRSRLKLLWRSFRLWQERSGANLRCSLGPFVKTNYKKSRGFEEKVFLEIRKEEVKKQDVYQPVI